MVADVMLYKVSAVGLSDVGLVRQNNEDVWAQLPDINFFILADGMGGHQAGEVAARHAVDDICHTLSRRDASEYHKMTLKAVEDQLKKAIRHANTFIFKLGRSNREYRGMGTTLCCLQFHPEGVIYAHVGDSRIYRLRDGTLTQLTKDHSLLSELIEQGEIKADQIFDFQFKNIITKAVGTESKVDPETTISDVRIGDTYLICSDGLSDLLSPQEITQVLSSRSELSMMAETLVAKANRKGGRDNITAILAKIDPCDAS